MKEITAKELQELRKSEEKFDLIDVREVEEKKVTDLGGVSIPLHTLLDNKDKIASDKKVVFYCRSGKRSGNAIKFLEKNYGFKNLFNLKGGILAYAEIDSHITKY